MQSWKHGMLVEQDIIPNPISTLVVYNLYNPDMWSFVRCCSSYPNFHVRNFLYIGQQNHEHFMSLAFTKMFTLDGAVNTWNIPVSASSCSWLKSVSSVFIRCFLSELYEKHCHSTVITTSLSKNIVVFQTFEKNG